MASSSSGTHGIESKYATLNLNEEEEDVLVIEGGYNIEFQEETRFVLIRKLLTEKPIKFNFMKDTLAATWRPGKGMIVREVTTNLFLFHFFHEVDMKRILEDEHGLTNKVYCC